VRATNGFMTNEHFNLRPIPGVSAERTLREGSASSSTGSDGLFRLANAVFEPRRVRRQANEPLLLSADNS
jgi:hypothetical protein